MGAGQTLEKTYYLQGASLVKVLPQKGMVSIIQTKNYLIHQRIIN